jgi:glycerophosphoryl diester phosphodiesterase
MFLYRGSMLVAFLAALLGSIAGPAAATDVAAHRGQAGVHENTLRAVAFADASGAAFVEADVRGTARPGQFVILHDSTLNRTTNCRGQVRDWTAWAISRRCRTDGGRRVPRLSAYLRRVRATDLRLLLELKPGLSRWQVRTVVHSVRKRGVARRTVLRTFSLTILRRVHRTDPTIPVAFMTADAKDPAIHAATTRGASGVHVRTDSLLANPSAVVTWRSQGLRVGAWTPDTAAAWKKLADMRVDVIITNRPRVAVRILHEKSPA